MEVLEADLHRTDIDAELLETGEEVKEVMGCKCQLRRLDIMRRETESAQ